MEGGSGIDVIVSNLDIRLLVKVELHCSQSDLGVHCDT